ncbi:CHAP domain-containing protein [Mucilaginibacter lappiensis]|uniref:Peptidase C51 domain-containing protein n=1 Tax=Mucilaginibacter lappiensis TaxID=354630 RepID=A0ABR6PIV0_9SPHI|nr:CHAP domain-containing protein [Mucilaginibacter lappiensis]MBB6109702.1 hypothetical protein [Mucilaginibacter lappiensis]SIR12405.1 CHAP domain-containing protein [Mucilaginibacter lappiensis]
MAKNKNLYRLLLICGIGLFSSFSGDPVRDRVQKAYTAEIGVREKTGHNDGIKVETYLHYVGLPKGNPWCASFVCWAYGQASVKNPKSGYCPDLFASRYVIYKRGIKINNEAPQKGDVWGLYFPEKGRVAHVGFVDEWQSKYVITVEGNTNDAGSREGDGVYRKRRLTKSIYVVANYIDKR